PEEGGLARAVRPEDGEHLAAADVERVDVDDEPSPVAATQPFGPEQAHRDGPPFRGAGPSPSHRPCCSRVSTRLTANARTRRTRPSAIAAAKLPRRVSSTMAVVMTRVSPRMLPPTILTAPTSELTAPKPATMAAPSPRRASRR